MIIIVQIEAIRIHAPHNMAARSATKIITMFHAASTPIVVDPSCSDIRERDAKRSAFHANLAKEQQATLEELLNNAPGWGGASS